jgi:hypothetical protein
MSSLQKFHRRTQSVGPVSNWVLATDLTDTTAPTYGGDGSGSDTIGYWLGNVGGFKLRVAPKSTEVTVWWGSSGTVRGTTFVNNGWANTNKLYAFGAAQVGGHPAASACTSLSTGGYNTWYMPAKKELLTIYSSRTKTPFATSNSLGGSVLWSSTESNDNYPWCIYKPTSGQYDSFGKDSNGTVRAVRRSTI